MSESRVQYGQIFGTVTQMMVMMALGFYGGYKLDEYLGNENNMYTLIIGLGVMFASLFLMVRRLNKIFEQEEK